MILFHLENYESKMIHHEFKIYCVITWKIGSGVNKDLEVECVITYKMYFL